MAGIPGSGGKKGRSGRKSKAEEMGLAPLLEKCWPERDREKVIRHLHALALGISAQSISAAQLLMGYTYGKPTERHEISNPDGSPLLQPVAEAITKIYGASKSE